MAEAAVSSIPSPALEVADQVFWVAVADIEVGVRLRPIDPVWALALGDVMEVEGHKDPITICRLPGRRGFHLVKGAHRLEGRSLKGHARIKSIITTADAMDRRMQEVSENLWRAGLNPIDRAAFVAELVLLHKLRAGLDPAKEGRSVSAQTRWAKTLRADAADATETISVAYGWAAEIGAKLDLTDRTIRNDLALHRGLPAILVAQLRGLPIAGNASQLLALAKMTPADQTAVVKLLVEGKAKGASDALGMVHKKPKPDPDKKAWSALFGAWTRMNARRRREALRELAKQGLPKGVSIVFDGDVS